MDLHPLLAKALVLQHPQLYLNLRAHHVDLSPLMGSAQVGLVTLESRGISLIPYSCLALCFQPHMLVF